MKKINNQDLNKVTGGMKNTKNKEKQQFVFHPTLCNGCNKCIEACPYQHLIIADGKVSTTSACPDDCDTCTFACPSSALIKIMIIKPSEYPKGLI